MEQREGPIRNILLLSGNMKMQSIYMYINTEKRKILLIIGESPKDTHKEELELVVNGLHELVELRVGT